MPRIPQLIVIPALVIAFGAGTALHGATLEAVTIQLLPGAEEPADGGVLGLGAGEPDYRVEVDLGRRTEDCGTLVDTPIGEGLRFAVPGSPPLASVAVLRLVEDDPAGDDLLEELDLGETPAEGGAVDGEAYRFVLETGWSLGTGIEGFMETIPGVLLAVILIMLVVMKAGILAMLPHIGD